MEIALVTDSSREIPQNLFQPYNIFPLGYYLRDNNGNVLAERTSIQDLQTSELINLAKTDKQAKLFAPTIKDFVELFTYLAEEYEHVICLHSSSITPLVFENALLGKKLVSEIDIDIIDTHTFGCSSGLLVEELAKTILKANTISQIRKESIALNRDIQSFLLTKKDNLHKIGMRKTSWLSSIGITLKPFYLYQFMQDEWTYLSKSRNYSSLLEDIHKRVQILNKAKNINLGYFSASEELKEEVNPLIKDLRNLNLTETSQSLVSYFLSPEETFDIAFI